MASLPSASLFSLPLPSWHQPLSARAAHSKTRKRRKSPDDWDQSDYGDGETTDAEAAGSALILSPDETRQYRVAGLSFNQEIPTGYFPHGPPPSPKKSKQADSQAQLIKELSALSPPVYPPQSAAQQGNLRLNHLAVLTAILHRCLLEGDFIRAGRAWGLLLREEYAGYAIDVRHEGRWGIGAEILLRRDRQLSQQSTEHISVDEDRSPPPPLASHGPLFTRKGFEDAKEYYERLIIQHPYRKAAPDAVSSLHFYTAMFGLWIYVVQEESTAAGRLAGQMTDESSDEEQNSDTDISLDGEYRSASGKGRRVAMAQIKQDELKQANQIAARMDEILVSPPFSDTPDLLELRGMVSLWIGDLLVSSLPGPAQRRLQKPELLHEEGVSESLDSIQARREQRLAMDKRQAEMQKARLFFEKARTRSKTMASSLESLHIDDTLPDL